MPQAVVDRTTVELDVTPKRWACQRPSRIGEVIAKLVDAARVSRVVATRSQIIVSVVLALDEFSPETVGTALKKLTDLAQSVCDQAPSA